jgi:hypothetical protein
MNAFKGVTNLKSLFPEQYSEFKAQHYLSVKNVLSEIQVNRSTHPHLSLRLKKEYSYTSTAPLCLHGTLYGELPLFVPFPHIHSVGIQNPLNISMLLTYSMEQSPS